MSKLLSEYRNCQKCEKMIDLQPAIKEIAKTLRKYYLTYDQSKYVFAEARKLAELTPEKKRSKGTVKRLSKDEKDRFLETAFKSSSLTGLMMLCLYETAARVDEFVKLKPEDLYPTEQKIIIQNGKGSKRREIPITEHLTRSLLVHLNGRTKGYIFETNRHTAFSTRRIQQLVKQVAQDAGIVMNVTPHTLRHTRATLLAEAGMAKDHLQVFLGHEKPETTQIYTYTANIDLQESFSKINA